MERPWLILGRILYVNPPRDDDDMLEVEDAEEHAVVGEAQAEEDAQAQEEQHAAAVDAVVEAHDDQQAEVGEGGAEAEAEAEEEEQQAQLEESILNVNTDAAASEAAHAAHGAAEPDFTIWVAPPPWLTDLVAGPGSHPDPARPDMYPYIIASGRFCLLVHFSIAPFYGTNFEKEPNHSNLVVVRHFRRSDNGQIEARAVHVPDRPEDNVNIPALANIESVGLICNHETGHYLIAELVVPTDNQDESSVIYIRTEDGVWYSNYFAYPFWWESRRHWVPHGSVTIGNVVFWFDLSWGIIFCDDLTQPHEEQILSFFRLPRGCVLRDGHAPDLHYSRCVAVSENVLRYVQIIRKHDQAATVHMWYRNPERWITNYNESFDDIWDDESYIQTGLPRKSPGLVGVSPVDSNVVYFTLDQRLFGVDVPEHRVVDCAESVEPLNRTDMLDDSVSSRSLITWNLDADGGNYHVSFYCACFFQPQFRYRACKCAAAICL